MAARQRPLDALLLSDQPVECAIKLLLVHPLEPEHAAERTDRRLRVERARRGKLRGRIDQARHDHRDAQRDLAPGLPAALRQQAVETELAQGAQPRRHMPVRQAAQQPQALIARRESLAAQNPAQRVDLAQRPMREIRQRPLLDFVALAIALAQQDGGRRIAVGNALDVHGKLES